MGELVPFDEVVRAAWSAEIAQRFVDTNIQRRMLLWEDLAQCRNDHVALWMNAIYERLDFEQRKALRLDPEWALEFLTDCGPNLLDGRFPWPPRNV